MQETINKLMKKNEQLIAQNEKLKEKQKTTRKYGAKEGDPTYQNKTFSLAKRLGSFTKFIGDGEKQEDKKSVTSGDGQNRLHAVESPDKYDKKSGSGSTLSHNE
mmetsp:Transcript_42040/g.48743  ORF Transcript_42040/g.48743 Transcript_42040/m.48743 type:complete len:104 (-) Transcript_42040:35-346(-)